MASIRMTRDLRHTIRRKAEEAYELANPSPKPSNEYIAAIRAAVICSPEQTFLREVKELGESRNLSKQARHGDNILPHSPKEPVTGLDLRSNVLPPVSPGTMRHSSRLEQSYKSTYIQLDTPLKEFLGTKESNNRWGDPTIWINDLDESDKTQIIEYFLAHVKTEDEYRETRRNYENSICKLVDACTTLKQLLEVWPAAESLVPYDKIQKMHAKVTRKQKAATIKEDISFDPTIANQAILTAKMLGG